MSTIKKSWREVLPPHPAADLFPMMTRDELITLGNDIKKNGLCTSPVIWEAQKDAPRYLLDGRNRLDAMQAVGLPVLDAKGVWLDFQLAMKCLNVRGDDPYAAVLSLNIHRRHLTAEQRRDLIAKVIKAAPQKSNRQIAEQVKADDKTVGKVRRELEATAEIPQLETTTGKDGKARKQPIKKKRRDVDDYLADKQAKHAIQAKPSISSERISTASVTIDSGPVTATLRLREVPQEKWHDLMLARRQFMEVKLSYDCRCLVQFVKDASEMYSALGFANVEAMIRDGYHLQPEEIDIAVQWLRGRP